MTYLLFLNAYTYVYISIKEVTVSRGLIPTCISHHTLNGVIGILVMVKQTTVRVTVVSSNVPVINLGIMGCSVR